MSTATAAPQQALILLAEQLREDETVISPLVGDPGGPPDLGRLAAAGPRAAEAPTEYAVVVEAVREGYLLHYGQPRLISGADSSLSLLAGDYLYALGLERLAAIGDQLAIRELSDLISLSAQLHSDGEGDHDLADRLWIAAVLAIGAGPSDSYAAAKQALRAGDSASSGLIWQAATEMARQAGVGDALDEVADSIHFSD